MPSRDFYSTRKHGLIDDRGSGQASAAFNHILIKVTRRLLLYGSQPTEYPSGMKNVAPLLLAGMLLVLAGCQAGNDPAPAMNKAPASTAPETPATVEKSDAEWRAILTPEQYYVLRQGGTERPNGPAYEKFKQEGAGTYSCAGCGAELFSSKEKFDSHCGWPSFYDPAHAKNVKQVEDRSAGMLRVEVRCARCDGHLGHVFKGEGFDTPTDLRYCINGVSLKYTPAAGAPAADKK